jgi:Zn-dependent peptidase ImmA (M78 family)
MRQRGTLAHELGHVLFEDWTDGNTGSSSDRTPAEIRADAFARHLLVPVDGLREFLGNRELVTQSTLSEPRSTARIVSGGVSRQQKCPLSWDDGSC